MPNIVNGLDINSQSRTLGSAKENKTIREWFTHQFTYSSLFFFSLLFLFISVHVYEFRSRTFSFFHRECDVNVMSMLTDRITFAFINKTEQKIECDQRDYKYFELTTDFIVEIKIIVDNFLDHQSHCCRYILFHLTNSVRWIRSFLLSYLLIFVHSRRKSCVFYFSGFGNFFRDFNVSRWRCFF